MTNSSSYVIIQSKKENKMIMTERGIMMYEQGSLGAMSELWEIAQEENTI